MKSIITIFQGVIMGTMEIVPGVSGSTMALVMGIYDEFINLLHSVTQVVKEFVKLIIGKSSKDEFMKVFKSLNFKFGILLGIGIVVAIIVFSHVFSFLIATYRNYVYALFLGLILASISVPWGEIKKKKISRYILIAVTTLVAFVVLGVNPVEAQGQPSLLQLFIGGILGISGMVLPGVSGSFIMLLLGVYEYVIGLVKSVTTLSLNSQDLTGLIVFLLGLSVGFTLFVKILKFALKNYRDVLMSLIIGLMIGSIRVIWPFIQVTEEGTEIVSPLALDTIDLIIIAVAFITGGLVVLILKKVSRKDPS